MQNFNDKPYFGVMPEYDNTLGHNTNTMQEVLYFGSGQFSKTQVFSDRVLGIPCIKQKYLQFAKQKYIKGIS